MDGATETRIEELRGAAFDLITQGIPPRVKETQRRAKWLLAAFNELTALSGNAGDDLKSAIMEWQQAAQRALQPGVSRIRAVAAVSPHYAKLPYVRRVLEVTGGIPERPAADQSTTTNRTASKVGRNDPCPCGSGKKWKKCHGGPSPPA